MGRRQTHIILAIVGLLFLASKSLAQQDENSSEDQGEKQQNYNYYEQLALVEYELFEMTPVMFTLYGEDFVDSVSTILRSQSLNSSVVGVLVTDLEYEESTMVATIIRSYFNDTILSQLGDIENYIASYIYDNVDQLSIEIARVACVHSRKVSSMSSETEIYHTGWAFVAGSSPDLDSSKESRSTGTVATVRYSRVKFTLGHEHSFGYGVNKKRSMGGEGATPKEIAELDDDFFEWYKFKVFHARNVTTVSENTKEWKSMTWNERSLQQTADTVWSKGGKGHMGTGAIAGTVTSVVTLGIAALAIVGYVIHRRRKRKQIEGTTTPSLDKICNGGTDEVTEETALV